MRSETPPKLVKSAIRTIELFNVFADARRPLSLAELSEKMKAPKSSCHELIQTLTHLGYTAVVEGGKSYYPSRRFYEMAEQINTYNPTKERIQNSLRALRDSTGETVFVGRLQGEEVYYSEVFDGTHTIRYSGRSGDFKSVHASALGKALLANLNEEAQKQLIGRLKLTRYTENTITTKKALKENLSLGRREGIYTTVGEHLPDVMALARPFDIRGFQIGIGIAGPIPRMQRNQVEYKRALINAVDAIVR